MRKLGLALLVVVAALFTATGATSGVDSQGARILGVSHSHPQGSSTSYVCVRIRGKKGERVTVSASGPGANVPGVRYRRQIRFRRAGTKVIRFQIAAPGPYTLRAGTARRTYSVPAPTPQHGPFRCIS